MDRFADLAQPAEFAAVALVVHPGPEILVRVIAELFELHERTQDEPFSLDAFRAFDGLPEIIHQLLIEHRLFSA